MRFNRVIIHSFYLAFASVIIPGTRSAFQQIKIGAIFHDGDEDYLNTFKTAISEVKYEHVAPAFDFEPVIKWINVDTDSFKTAATVCELLEEGVAAIFGPPSPHTRGIVASMAARFQVPHIEYVWRSVEDVVSAPMTINVYPDSDMTGQAIADVVGTMNWRKYAALYETNEGLSRIQKSLTLNRKKNYPIIVRQLGEGPDYRTVLKEINLMGISNILLDIKPQHIIQVLNQAKEVKLLSDYCNLVITYLDSIHLPIPTVQNGTSANITGFNLLENDVPGIEWVENAVLYDSVFLLHQALEGLYARAKESEESPDFITPVALSCDEAQKYPAGANITSLMRELAKEGKMTGPMAFDENGRRSFTLRIIEFRNYKPVNLGFWDVDGIHFTRSEEDLEQDLFKSIEEKTFRISTRVGPPYLMEVTDSATRGVLFTNGLRYEGYCVDLIEKIANILKFKYIWHLVPDNAYGSLSPTKKTWNGLIRDLLDHQADLAICDLTITYERESAVDFTMPFMNLGISILFSKPEEKEHDLFSFLSPLSTDVWIYMATAYLAVSVMLFLQARMAPDEWDNPHPCNPDPEELENNFNFKNSLWLTIGSLMQQGSDILPKAPSIRMIAGMWWFYVLIMVSSYTANLAAFLTYDKMDTPIKDVEDLAKQTKIKYGAVKGGSTMTFFRDSNFSTYQRMWAAMSEARPSVFTTSNDEGVERVVKGKRTYAFLMESTSIEYRMERNCDIDKIGGLIDNKGYGIALPLNSPYRTPISGAILTLQEKGELNDLKTKWWSERGGGLCKDVDSGSAASSAELGMANVGGVFLVLMIGCGLSFLVAIFEFLWNVRKVAVEEKMTPGEAFVAELKFAVNIWAETKPVKMAKSGGSSNSSGKSSNNGLGRAASTARSIVGSFLRLDMLDKFDKDDNTNNKNNEDRINN